jgi:alkanesulfonate monooxygenase SsuD/methylene tetrahydromethanopterin reductase-like flavin-dependent oxidoreductase (luciferase family)
VKYGLTLPIFDELADPTLLADFAAEAEAEGWQGFFVWDHVYYRPPATAATDPWVSLAAAGMRTSSIRLGPMVTPLARRRPHVLARQVAALDQLTGGRVVLGTGLGLDTSGGEWERFDEVVDVRVRAAMYDEALDLLRALLSGDPVDHVGAHFTARDVRFLPRPLQPRVPIWVAARWPNRRPLNRAAMHDGAFVIDLGDPADLRNACDHLRTRRPEGLDGFEVVTHGPATADPGPWAAAGATWWLTTFDPFTVTADEVRATIRRRPGG